MEYNVYISERNSCRSDEYAPDIYIWTRRLSYFGTSRCSQIEFEKSTSEITRKRSMECNTRNKGRGHNVPLTYERTIIPLMFINNNSLTIMYM